MQSALLMSGQGDLFFYNGLGRGRGEERKGGHGNGVTGQIRDDPAQDT